MSHELEIDEILRELVRAAGAISATVGPAGVVVAEPDVPEEWLRRAELGSGAELVLAPSDAPGGETDAAMARAVRDLRSCLRRWGVETVTEPQRVRKGTRSRAGLVRRIAELAGALAAMHDAVVVIMRGREVVAAGGELTDARREELAFLCKRIDLLARKQRGHSSHAEIVTDDVYARGFWFDAYLVMFFTGPGWAVDFVRHRALLVTREVSEILPNLDDDPPSPAQIKPRPEGT